MISQRSYKKPSIISKLRDNPGYVIPTGPSIKKQPFKVIEVGDQYKIIPIFPSEEPPLNSIIKGPNFYQGIKLLPKESQLENETKIN